MTNLNINIIETTIGAETVQAVDLYELYLALNNEPKGYNKWRERKVQRETMLLWEEDGSTLIRYQDAVDYIRLYDLFKIRTGMPKTTKVKVEPRKSYIYLLAIYKDGKNTDVVKFGTTDDIERRIEGLNTSWELSGIEFRLEQLTSHKILNALSIESAIHTFLSKTNANYIPRTKENGHSEFYSDIDHGMFYDLIQLFDDDIIFKSYDTSTEYQSIVSSMGTLNFLSTLEPGHKEYAKKEHAKLEAKLSTANQEYVFPDIS